MEQSTSTAVSRISGWFKAMVGTVAGLLSGAVVMYLTPLVDKVVRPSRPVANFGVEHQGLAVTLVNRAAGGGEGWWDFGDGSPLEPFTPQQPAINHAYPKQGSYNVKLTVRNLIGEENERVIPVNLEDAQIEPRILKLEAVPVMQGAYAPATFEVFAKTENAQLCIWNFEDDKPLQISTDPKVDAEMGRRIVFDKPGGYTIKLAAVNGRQAKERSTIVYVNEPPPNTVTAMVSVSDTATKVERLTTPIDVPLLFPAGSKDAVVAIEKLCPARQGFEILDAKLQPVTSTGVRNLRLEVTPDRRFVQLSGELVRDVSWLRRSATPATVFAQAVLTQERRVPVSRPAQMVTATMTIPGTVLLPMPALPPDFVEPQRQVRLELRDGDRIIWQDSQLPRAAKVVMQNRHCLLTAAATGQGDQVRVEIAEQKLPHPTAN